MEYVLVLKSKRRERRRKGGRFMRELFSVLPKGCLISVESCLGLDAMVVNRPALPTAEHPEHARQTTGRTDLRIFACTNDVQEEIVRCLESERDIYIEHILISLAGNLIVEIYDGFLDIIIRGVVDEPTLDRWQEQGLLKRWAVRDTDAAGGPLS